MGCFDTIICKYPLPGVELPYGEQTKAYDCTLSCVTIQPCGTLTRDYGRFDPATMPTERDYEAVRGEGYAGVLALLDKRVWLPDVRRVDFTGVLFVASYLLYFDRGRVTNVRQGAGYPDPFSAPGLESWIDSEAPNV